MASAAAMVKSGRGRCAGGPTDRGQGGADRSAWPTSSRKREMISRLKSTDSPIPRAMTRLRAKMESGTAPGPDHDAEGHGDGDAAPTGGTATARGPRKTKNGEQQERQGEELSPPKVLRGDRCDLDAGHGGPPSQVLVLSDGWAAMAFCSAVTAFCSLTAPTVATTVVASRCSRSCSSRRWWRSRGRASPRDGPAGSTPPRQPGTGRPRTW